MQGLGLEVARELRHLHDRLKVERYRQWPRSFSIELEIAVSLVQCITDFEAGIQSRRIGRPIGKGSSKIGLRAGITLNYGATLSPVTARGTQ